MKLQSLIKGLNDNIHKGIKGETVCFSDLGEAYSGLSGKVVMISDMVNIHYLYERASEYISEKDYELVQIVPTKSKQCAKSTVMPYSHSLI